MIEVLKINGQPTWVNCEQIRSIDKTPDTRLLFVDGQSLLVKESPEQITEKIIAYKKKLNCSN